MFVDYSKKPNCYSPVLGSMFDTLAARYSDLCRASRGTRAEATNLLFKYRMWVTPDEAYRCLWQFCDLPLRAVVVLHAKQGRRLDWKLLAAAARGEHSIPVADMADYCERFMHDFWMDYHGDLLWGTEKETYLDTPVDVISIDSVVPGHIYLVVTKQAVGVPFGDTHWYVHERDGRIRFVDLFDYEGYGTHDPQGFPYVE